MMRIIIIAVDNSTYISSQHNSLVIPAQAGIHYLKHLL